MRLWVKRIHPHHFEPVFIEDPLERKRNQAIERFRGELNVQYNGLKRELVDVVMKGPQAQFKEMFQKKLKASRTRLGGESDRLKEGLVAIDDLTLTLVHASTGQATKRETEAL